LPPIVGGGGTTTCKWYQLKYCQEYFDFSLPSVLRAKRYIWSELRASFVCAVIIVSIWFDYIPLIVFYHVCLVNKDSQFRAAVRATHSKFLRRYIWLLVARGKCLGDVQGWAGGNIVYTRCGIWRSRESTLTQTLRRIGQTACTQPRRTMLIGDKTDKNTGDLWIPSQRRDLAGGKPGRKTRRLGRGGRRRQLRQMA